ncbi:unnamed protein product [Sphenostylis stenocarpa]|uniref:Uncharacterized protein n=1 Tax=Sphenostylis stenocarpa TaxID=92480 RepID=A0AA86W347_9FABA|nr:unnamed protein product [Sphenostylis stenocarpa]
MDTACGWLVLPQGHIKGGSQGRVVWLFCEKVGKITIRRPKKGPNPTTMDKQITKEFFRIKVSEEVAKVTLWGNRLDFIDSMSMGLLVESDHCIGIIGKNVAQSDVYDIIYKRGIQLLKQ